MTYLSDDERNAIQTSYRMGSAARIRRAGELVNPASGLANDYLNLFNEIVMLVEQLPSMPELIDDIMAWRPTSYQEYFRASILPGRESALAAYDKLDARFRRGFEQVVEELDRRSTGSVAAVRRKFRASTDQGEPLSVICDRAGASIREVLEKATMLVNHGAVVEDDIVQERADALMRRVSERVAREDGTSHA